RGHKAALKVWADAPEIRQSAIELLMISGNKQALITSTAQAKLRSWFQPLQQATDYQGYFIIGPGNYNLASSRDQNVGVLNLLIKQEKFLQKVWSGKTAISFPQKSDVPLPDKQKQMHEELPTMFVGAPIFNEFGQVLAIFTFRLDPTEDFTDILQQGRVGQTGETYAFDDSGRLISNSRFDEQLREIGLIATDEQAILNVELRDPMVNLVKGLKSEVPREQQSLTRMAELAIAGKSGVDMDGYRNYLGVPVVGAWLWNSELGLGIATELEVSEAYQLLRSTQHTITNLTIFIILLLAGMATTYSFYHQRKQTENALQNIVEGTSPHIGQNFFRVLVKHLADVLSVQYAFVGELFGDQNDAIQTIAVWSGENYAENFQYKLAGTPCENVTVREIRCYSQDIQKMFPDDHLRVEMNAESYAGMPLLDSSGKLLGILAVLDVKSIENISLTKSLITVFADRAAVELERKHSESKTLQLLQQNRELTQRMFEIQEDERRYLARELHDEFGQQLAAIHLNAETIKMLSRKQNLKIHEYAQVIDEIATNVHKNMRNILRQLRPTLLDEMGLADSLKELTNQWQVQFPTIQIKFSMEGELNDLEDSLNIAIYRIIQESLTNVAKHAKAHNVSVQLIRQPGGIDAQDCLLLIVEDNGKGLDGRCITEGIGLPGLRERVLAVGGKFEIKSIKGKGVQIKARIPLDVAM
nr:sensor histidine kinase [Betaproteobacteria bacterium]